MCGIGGWISFGGKFAKPGTVTRMLTALEERGQDASGITWANEWGGNTGYLKHHVIGSQLLSKAGKLGEELSPQIDKALICLLHTRAQSQGPASQNCNNHPIFRKNGKYTVVHNGHITNDDGIFEKLKQEREAEVDTEALVALLDSEDTPASSRAKTELASGGYAYAAMPRTSADHVILVRHISPLLYVYNADADIMYFASTFAALIAAVHDNNREKPRGLEHLGISFPHTVEDDHFLLINKDGLFEEGKHSLRYNIARTITGRSSGWSKGTIYDYKLTPPTTIPNACQTTHYNSKVEPGYLGPIVLSTELKAKLPDGGAMWDRGECTLTRPLGFGRPEIFSVLYDEKSTMTKFKGLFPLPCTENKKLEIQCPACWNYVNLEGVRIRGFTCPICETALQVPSILHQSK